MSHAACADSGEEDGDEGEELGEWRGVSWGDDSQEGAFLSSSAPGALLAKAAKVLRLRWPHWTYGGDQSRAGLVTGGQRGEVTVEREGKRLDPGSVGT